MKHIKTILIIIFIILILGTVTVFTYVKGKVSENPAGTVGNYAGNLYNGGLFCENDGQVFFANPYDQNTLYVMNSDESNIEKIGTVGISSLNAAGDYLYYYQNGAGDGSGLGYTMQTTGMYRSTKDGKDTLCLKRDPVATLLLIDNAIFYQHFDGANGVMLDRISIDKSSEKTVLSGLITPASASDSVLYFADPDNDYYLYSYDTRSGMKSLIWPHRVYNPIFHTDGYIYFMDIETEYEIHRYHPMTGEHHTLTKDRVETYNVYDNYIYYQKFSQTEPVLMRMYTDGSHPEVVSYGNFEKINITSNYVYFNEYGKQTPLYKQSLSGSVGATIFQP